MTSARATITATVLRLVGVLLLFLAAAPGDAATRKECRPSACQAEIGSCKAACTTGSRRQQRTCRRKCKKTVTKACRSDDQPCGGTTGGPPGGTCAAFPMTCPARSLDPLRTDAPTCTGASGAAQPCDADFDTKFRVRTPWRTHAGECCVVDGCRGTTASGVYDSLALPPIVPPGSSPLLAPVTVSVQSLSTYFQRPSTGPGIPGQWGHHTATIFNLSCQTPPKAGVINVAGGVLTAYDKTDFSSYDTRPVPPPTGNWDFLSLSPDGLSVSFTPPQPPLLPPCGSAPDTAVCQPHLFSLDTVNLPGALNPITGIVAESIKLDRLCDNEVFASATGTFQRRDGSQCSVTIYTHAQIGCDTNDDCLPPEECTTTDPTAPADFGNAFPGWAGKSCVIPTP